MSDHVHDFASYEVCRVCGQTEAASADECHHCNDDLSRKNGRCWWCLRPVPRDHDWQFYANGTFCRRCGAAVGSGTPCR